MGQALYRKHRPKKLAEVVGQKHVTKTLQQALQQGRISHAYLFTGPRGVGKTSIARILAHEVNDLPYKDDSLHIDIIEIDAASNRRIDEIRELRDKVYVAPTSAKYKVYIIDEVHMLTREAFNALLKTLEEPPAHVIFILATTDAHKLPATIISRTQRFGFKPAEPAKSLELLRQIAASEKLQISDEALELIAEHSDGSFRDSVSLLDQAANQADKIEADNVRQLLGVPPVKALQDLLDLIIAGSSSAELLSALTTLYDQGYSAAAIAKQLSLAVRRQLVDGESLLNENQALQLLSKLVEVPSAHDPDRFLEIILLQARPPVEAAAQLAVTVQAEPLEQEDAKTQPSEKRSTEKAVKGKKSAKAQSVSKTSKTNRLDVNTWPEVLQALKSRHNTLYGLIRMAQPEFADDNRLKLAFAFSFHQKRLMENSNQQKLIDIIKDLTGEAISIECLVDKKAAPFQAVVPTIGMDAPESPKSAGDDLSAISNIFGKAELLES